MKPGQGKPLPKKSGFVFVGRTADFDKKSHLSVRIMGKPVAVFRQGETGGYYAREMGCKHQGADLSAMPIRDNIVVCDRHGWKYDVATGRCVSHDAPPLRSHEVAVEGEAVFVSLFPVDA